MRGIKCRLCQCLVDKQTGFSCSLNDDGFRSMIKTVFPFPVSPVHTVADKTYEMPVMVCFQCSTAIRNFYNFSKQVEVIQRKLKRECLGTDKSMSIDQLVQYIKAEPALQEELSENTSEALMLSADSEATECESKNTSSPMNFNEEENHRDHLHFHNRPIVQDCKWISKPSYELVTCVDKTEIVNNIVNVEKRIKLVATKLEGLLQTNVNSMQQNPRPRDSFEFNPITSEDECASFNDQLANKEYMDKIASWLASRISSNDSRQRMHESVDLLLGRVFMASCSWTGTSGTPEITKVMFRRFENLLELFRLIGTTNAENLDDKAVANFFKTKLYNAKCRLSFKGLRKSVSHRYHRKACTSSNKT